MPTSNTTIITSWSTKKPERHRAARIRFAVLPQNCCCGPAGQTVRLLGSKASQQHSSIFVQIMRGDIDMCQA